VDVVIGFDSAELWLKIVDNGSGIDQALLAHGSRSGHWGLPGMRERAEKLGGRLEIWSRPGEGTTVHLSVPARVIYRGEFKRGNRFWFLRGQHGFNRIQE